VGVGVIGWVGGVFGAVWGCVFLGGGGGDIHKHTRICECVILWICVSVCNFCVSDNLSSTIFLQTSFTVSSEIMHCLM